MIFKNQPSFNETSRKYAEMNTQILKPINVTSFENRLLEITAVLIISVPFQILPRYTSQPYLTRMREAGRKSRLVLVIISDPKVTSFNGN